MSIQPVPSRHNFRLRRREALRLGSVGLVGAGVASTSVQTKGATAGGSFGRAKSLVIVWLTGAASHHDTFDMKLDAPKEIRGEFEPISTSIPGYTICENLPLLAQRMDRMAVIRSLSHGDNNHLMSTHHVLTGTKQPGGFFDKVASRDDWPDYAGAYEYLRVNRGGLPSKVGIPSGVNLPTYMQQGPLTWPGQHAGFLGPQYDPWQIVGDPNKEDFKVDTLTLADDISVSRLEHRKALLSELNSQQRSLESVAESRRLSSDQQEAFSILTSSGLARAFKLDHESDEMRDRYGRNQTGQSLLLARRLVEVGVPVVQVNTGPAQTWDNHSAIFNTLKDRLLPPLDQGVSALLDDLGTRELLDSTMVMVIGEFGRTPKINGNAGRDHWGPCFFGLFAGAGIHPGQVIGESDKEGAYPLTHAYSPDDVGATVYHALGIDPHTIVHDRLDRPVHLNAGSVIEPLFSGAQST